MYITEAAMSDLYQKKFSLDESVDPAHRRSLNDWTIQMTLKDLNWGFSTGGTFL